jgi:hypothetical protein
MVTPPSVAVFPQLDEPVPVSVCVVEPSVHVILQLDPLPLDVQVTPSVASVPHRQRVTPDPVPDPSVTVQHGPELLLEHPAVPGRPSARARPNASPTAPRCRIPRSYGDRYRTSIGPRAK